MCSLISKTYLVITSSFNIKIINVQLSKIIMNDNISEMEYEFRYQISMGYACRGINVLRTD